MNLEFASITLPMAGPSVLACGAWLKNTICRTQDNQAYLSPLIGDLDSAEARQKLDDMVEHMSEKLNCKPEIVAHDLHPDFYSTQFAIHYANTHNLPLVAVQHHHAHIAAVCAEHQIVNAVLGLALDGMGLGTDNTAWGGELLYVSGDQFKRLGHLKPLAMPGGDIAAREPWRMAAAALFQLGCGQEIAARFSNQPAVETVVTMLQRNFNCPATSSMGRLFDAAAGLLGVSTIQSHEAQAAIQLQQLAAYHKQAPALVDGYQITSDNVLDFSPLLLAMMDAYQEGDDPSYAAAMFHATLAAGLSEWIMQSAHQYNLSQIAFGGGCFHNALLLQLLTDRLASAPLHVLTAHIMQPNDSAISLGQACIAMNHKKTAKYA